MQKKHSHLKGNSNEPVKMSNETYSIYDEFEEKIPPCYDDSFDSNDEDYLPEEVQRVLPKTFKRKRQEKRKIP